MKLKEKLSRLRRPSGDSRKSEQHLSETEESGRTSPDDGGFRQYQQLQQSFFSDGHHHDHAPDAICNICHAPQATLTRKIKSVVDAPSSAAKGAKDHKNCLKCNQSQPDSTQVIALPHSHEDRNDYLSMGRNKDTGRPRYSSESNIFATQPLQTLNSAFSPSTRDVSNGAPRSGLCYLQCGNEVKKALVPLAGLTLDGVHKRFVEAYPNILTYDDFLSKTMIVYIKDPQNGLFYELHNPNDIKDKAYLCARNVAAGSRPITPVAVHASPFRSVPASPIRDHPAGGMKLSVFQGGRGHGDFNGAHKTNTLSHSSEYNLRTSTSLHDDVKSSSTYNMQNQPRKIRQFNMPNESVQRTRDSRTTQSRVYSSQSGRHHMDSTSSLPVNNPDHTQRSPGFVSDDVFNETKNALLKEVHNYKITNTEINNESKVKLGKIEDQLQSLTEMVQHLMVKGPEKGSSHDVSYATMERNLKDQLSKYGYEEANFSSIHSSLTELSHVTESIPSTQSTDNTLRDFENIHSSVSTLRDTHSVQNSVINLKDTGTLQSTVSTLKGTPGTITPAAGNSGTYYSNLLDLRERVRLLRAQLNQIRKLHQHHVEYTKCAMQDTAEQINLAILKFCINIKTDEESKCRSMVNISQSWYNHKVTLEKLEREIREIEAIIEELREGALKNNDAVDETKVEELATNVSDVSKLISEVKSDLMHFDTQIDQVRYTGGSVSGAQKRLLTEGPQRLESYLLRIRQLANTLLTLQKLSVVQIESYESTRIQKRPPRSSSSIHDTLELHAPRRPPPPEHYSQDDDPDMHARSSSLPRRPDQIKKRSVEMKRKRENSKSPGFFDSSYDEVIQRTVTKTEEKSVLLDGEMDEYYDTLRRLQNANKELARQRCQTDMVITPEVGPYNIEPTMQMGETNTKQVTTYTYYTVTKDGNKQTIFSGKDENAVPFEKSPVS